MGTEEELRMVDLLLMVAVAWCAYFGWKRGFLRTCIDALALVVPLFFLTLSIPFLKSVLFDEGWNFGLAKWMAGHLVKTSPYSNGFMELETAQAVTKGLNSHAPAVVERFYDLFLLGLMGGAVFIGLQMILRVYETLWRDAHGMWRSQALGGLMGLGIGLTISTYLVSVLGLICWIQGMQWLDQGLMQSVFVHALYRFIFW
ncbi:hypothetical protein CBW65_07065 [Tumebacillus avium]|uniref:Colicin V production protein n=1 Tax=Tumebacillus avium TaxID=1903704 RepID=A0A1Y0IM48_9BACL|nr:hypothetical protein [Tumebacillus avium]ARU60886.1 hypothetical protein CBW65_07065 [Tumebacillus avium]